MNDSVCLVLDYLPFDAHVHFRNPGSPIFNAVVPLTLKSAGGAVVMPNIIPFITDAEKATAYQAAIREKFEELDFQLVMTGYLQEGMTVLNINAFYKAGVKSMKAYPKGATTNSHGGIADFAKCDAALSQMEALGMRLLVHPEQNVHPESGEEVDPYDREMRYLEYVLFKLIQKYPRLKICVEHVTTKTMARFISIHGGDRLACTVTAHHLMANRKDFFRDGPDVHLHCWPILKREEDMFALRDLVTSGHDFVFAGTDSAPHPTHAKEKACGCAGGVFTAHAWVEMYAEVFEDEDALSNLEKFLCINGPKFYDLKPREEKSVLVYEPWKVDSLIEVEDGTKIFPFGYHTDPDLQKVLRHRWIRF